jgi:mycothiol synthase
VCVLEVVLRTPSASDLSATRQLCAAALDHDDDPGEIADLLLAPAPGTDRRCVAAFAAHGLVGVAAGALRTGMHASTGHLDLVAVRPDYRRGGVGRALVEHVSAWALARGARELWWGNDAPTYAWPGVDHEYRAAHRLALALGFHAEREASNMTVDLRAADLDTSAEEARLARVGVQVTRLDPADQAELAGFLTWVGSFGGTWRLEAARSLSHAPVGCHVARRGGEWLGFACHGVNRRGWFGPMATAEPARGQGIGAVLLRRCLADQRTAGLTSAQISWAGPVSFYSRTVGATIGRQFTLYRKDSVE